MQNTDRRNPNERHNGAVGRPRNQRRARRGESMLFACLSISLLVFFVSQEFMLNISMSTDTTELDYFYNGSSSSRVNVNMEAAISKKEANHYITANNDETSRQEIKLKGVNQGRRKPSNDNTLNPFLGFIRLKKTGSTAMMSFLNNKSGLYTWHHFLDNYESYYNSTNNLVEKTVPNCVFGLPQLKQKLNVHDEIVTMYKKKNHNCLHNTFASTKKMWEQSLPYVNPLSTSTALSANATMDTKPVLKVFTMVREPYERLRSLFYYVRRFFLRGTFVWKSLFTEEQYDKVRTGDLGGWIELLHLEKKAFGIQHFLLHQNVDKAISLIEGEDEENEPQIFILLTECFEASLRLIDEKLLSFPNPTAIDDFVRSKQYTTNVNNASVTTTNSTKEISMEDDDILREKTNFGLQTIIDFTAQLF